MIKLKIRTPTIYSNVTLDQALLFKQICESTYKTKKQID